MLRLQLRRLLVILALLSVMALIAKDLYARYYGPRSYEAAQAIAGGYANDDAPSEVMGASARFGRLPTDPAAQRDQLYADELTAGAVWAKIHHAQVSSDCPADSHVFYAGCVAAVRGEWPEVH